MPHKASIGIYQRELKQDDNSSCPLVPDLVFEIAKKIVENKGQEIVKTKDGFFLVSYSETGPFTDVSNNEWMPVQIVRLKQWTAGGIKMEEFRNYVLGINDENLRKENEIFLENNLKKRGK